MSLSPLPPLPWEPRTWAATLRISIVQLCGLGGLRGLCWRGHEVSLNVKWWKPKMTSVNAGKSAIGMAADWASGVRTSRAVGWWFTVRWD